MVKWQKVDIFCRKFIKKETTCWDRPLRKIPLGVATNCLHHRRRRLAYKRIDKHEWLPKISLKILNAPSKSDKSIDFRVFPYDIYPFSNIVWVSVCEMGRKRRINLSPLQHCTTPMEENYLSRIFCLVRFNQVDYQHSHLSQNGEEFFPSTEF